MSEDSVRESDRNAWDMKDSHRVSVSGGGTISGVASPEAMAALEELGLQPRDLAKAESIEAHRLDLGWWWIPMLAVLLFFVGTLALPFTGKATGIDILVMNDTARVFGARPLEQWYVCMGLVSIVFLIIVTIVVRRTSLAYLTWACCGVTMLFAIFMIWMGQTRLHADSSRGTEFGALLNALFAVCAFGVLCCVIMRRSTKEQQLSSIRREIDYNDEVAGVQDTFSTMRRISPHEDNPLLIDDRRQRARDHHKSTRKEEA